MGLYKAVEDRATGIIHFKSADKLFANADRLSNGHPCMIEMFALRQKIFLSGAAVR